MGDLPMGSLEVAWYATLGSTTACLLMSTIEYFNGDCAGRQRQGRKPPLHENFMKMKNSICDCEFALKRPTLCL